MGLLAGSLTSDSLVRLLDASEDGLDLICNIYNEEDSLEVDSLLDSRLNELSRLTTTNVPEAHHWFLFSLRYFLFDFFVVEPYRRHQLLAFKTTWNPSLVEEVGFTCPFRPRNQDLRSKIFWSKSTH